MVVDDAVNVLVAFIRNVQLHRAIMAVNTKPAINFWLILHGNCMDMAAIEWCKLFGNDSETVHWKRMVPPDQHDVFRAGLFDAVGYSQDEWGSYRESIVKFRNTMAAHLDVTGKRPRNFPTYDPALRAAHYYYDWLFQHAPVADLPDVRTYSKDFRVHSEGVARLAMAATAEVVELDITKYVPT